MVECSVIILNPYFCFRPSRLLAIDSEPLFALEMHSYDRLLSNLRHPLRSLCCVGFPVK